MKKGLIFLILGSVSIGSMMSGGLCAKAISEDKIESKSEVALADTTVESEVERRLVYDAKEAYDRQNLSANKEVIYARGRVTVCGTAEVKIIPDTAVVSIGIETLHKNINSAVEDNAVQIKEVVSKLNEMGVDKDNIKTKDYNVYAKYDYNNGKKFLGYSVSNYIDFRTKDVDKLGSMIDAVVGKGANTLNGVKFELEDKTTAYNIALEKAMTNAIEKARILFGTNDLRVVDVREDGTNAFDDSAQYLHANVLRSSTQIYKGEMTIRCNIKVIVEKNTAV